MPSAHKLKTLRSIDELRIAQLQSICSQACWVATPSGVNTSHGGKAAGKAKAKVTFDSGALRGTWCAVPTGQAELAADINMLRALIVDSHGTLREHLVWQLRMHQTAQLLHLRSCSATILHKELDWSQHACD